MKSRCISFSVLSLFLVSFIIPQNLVAQVSNGCPPGARFNIYSGQACAINSQGITTPAPQVSSCLHFIKNISRGMRSADIQKLQVFLKAQGDMPQFVMLSTMFGPATLKAVQIFQLRTGVVANAGTAGYGNLGPKTREKIRSISCVQQDPLIDANGNMLPSHGGGLTNPGQTSTPSVPSQPTNPNPVPPVEPSPVATYPASTILTPGTGFVGITAQPSVIGSGAGSDAKAIARWDVVPYQTFETTFNIGVVAFHMNDIDRVEFSANNGPWTAIQTPTLNPQSNLVEYWATLRASDFADGQLEVRAIAYPKVGIPRVLQGTAIQSNGEYSLIMFANSRGTLARSTLYVSLAGSDTTGDGTTVKPYATISKAIDKAKSLGSNGDGAQIILKDAGTYAGPNRGLGSQHFANNRFVTIQPATGLTKDQVIIGNPTRTTLKAGVSKIQWKGVSLDLYTIGQFYNGHHWFDQSTWFSSGDMVALSIATKVLSPTVGPSFITDSDVRDTLYGTTNQMLVRNTKLLRVFGDAFQNAHFVVNSTLHDMLNQTSHHTDIYQMFGAMDNTIVYGVEAQNIKGAQAIFLEPTFYSTLGQPQHRLKNSDATKRRPIV